MKDGFDEHMRLLMNLIGNDIYLLSYERSVLVMTILSDILRCSFC